jgi:chaperonin GroEL
VRARAAIESNKDWKSVYGKKNEVTAEDVGHAKFDYAAGMEVVRRALSVPLQTIADNAGEKGTVVVAKVSESTVANFGFNALSLKYGDLLKDGVITPAKVDRTALVNASSVATLLLTADCIITDKPVEKDAGGAGGHDHGMGGMGGGMGGMPGMGGMGF